MTIAKVKEPRETRRRPLPLAAIMPAVGRQQAPKDDIYYPESDGKPMGETDWHISVILYLREALRYFFRMDEQIYVAANMLLYYLQDDAHVFKAPDVFVVKGVARHERPVYKLWQEGVAPCVIFEVTSRGTQHEDTGDKLTLYEQIGIREYFMFDPLNEFLDPQMQGYRLEGRSYVRLTPQADGSLFSRELGLILRPQGRMLRLVESKTQRELPTAWEAMQQAEVETRRAHAAMQRAQAESQRAQAESQRAQAALYRAEAEAARAAEAEAELMRLRAELERLRTQR